MSALKGSVKAPLTPGLTCIFHIACDRHFYLKVLACCVLHVQDVVGTQNLSQSETGGEHRTHMAQT